MKNTLKHFITINNKKYFYILKNVSKDTTFVECESANIAQEFLKEDVEELTELMSVVEKKTMLDRIQIGADLRTRIDWFDYKNDVTNHEEEVHALGSTRFRLILKSDITKNLKFSGRLAMYKNWNDSDFTEDRFIEIYNSDLANGLGNLVQRVSKMCEKNKMNGFNKLNKNDKEFIWENMKSFKTYLNGYYFNQAIEEIWNTLSLAFGVNIKNLKDLDRLINEKKPWELNNEKAKEVLKVIVINILNLMELLQIFLPEIADKIIDIFTADQIKAPEKPLFPRI